MLEKTGNSDLLFSQLHTAFSKPLWKKEVTAYAQAYGDKPEAMKTLLELALCPVNEIGFRASWILEFACITQPNRLLHILHPLVARFGEQKNASAQRHFGKLVCLFSSPKASTEIQELVGRQDLEPVINTLFEWLVTPKTPVAVKANAMEALSLLIPRQPWIKEELLQTIDHLLDKETIAFFGRAKKIKPKILKH